MCVIRDECNDPGHEPGREENGSRFQSGMRLWLAQNWLILSLLIAGSAWAANIQEAKASKLLVEREVENIHDTMKDMAEDIAYIRGVLDAQTKTRSETP